MTYRERQCVTCGVTIRPTSSTQRFCAECRRAHTRDMAKVYHERCTAERREELRLYHRQYAATHVTEFAAYSHAYRQRNPEWATFQRRVSSANRTARRHNAPGSLTIDQYRLVVEAADGRCYYCGCRPEILTCDHMVPFCRGGTNEITNIVPACLKCNQRKGTCTANEFLNILGLLPLAEDTQAV